MEKKRLKEEVTLRVREVINEAKSSGMTDSEIKDILTKDGYRIAEKEVEADRIYKKGCSILNCLLFKAYPILFALALLAYPLFKLFTGAPCLISEISPFGEAVNPVVDCEICRGVTEAPRLRNLSKDDFIRNYAYTSKPILVEGAASNWSALDVVSYDFFKSLYMERPESLEEDNSGGQFFAYSSNIRDLKGLFSLPEDVATMKTEKWYIGW